MKRRTFIGRGLACGIAGGILSSAVGCRSGKPVEDASRELGGDVKRVMTAMLAMQRDAWEQGVAAQALLELGETDLVVLMAKAAVVRRLEDGRLAYINPNHGVTDPAANGEAVLFAARTTGDPALRGAAEGMLDYLLNKAPRTEDGTFHHVDHLPQVWIDSAYMAPPFLAVAGHPGEAVRQIEGFRRLLWDPEKKLFSHIWDDGKKTFHRRVFWGGGNGWAAAGMARIIRALPLEMNEERGRLARYVEEVVEGCLAHQRADGLFHDVVDDPGSFVETNLAQMLAYAIYRGVAGGWLDASRKPAADRMRKAAHGKVDRLGLVQDVCGSPIFDSPGTSTEGQAFFLLMEAACRDLSSGNRPGA